MKRDVEFCLDTSLVDEAARAMRDRNVGFLPVCDETRAVRGALTDRDIVIRVLAPGAAPDRTPVARAMTPEVIWCRPDDELSMAEDQMIRFQKSRIICADAQRRLAGVISLSDVARRALRGHAGKVAASIAVREAGPPRVTREDGETLRCGDVMRTHVECCRLDDQVPAIAALMRSHNVGFVPVCDDDGAVVGTLTDRDLVVRVVAEGSPAEGARADDVRTREVVSCSPDEPLRVAEERMMQHKKSRIVCLAGRRPVGVISLSDIARVERPRAVRRVLRGVLSRPGAQLR